VEPAHGALPTGTLTFLFTDLEGSTRLLDALGERYGEVLEGIRGVLRAACSAHGGTEFGTEGDAVFMVFTRAPDAVMTAIAAQQALHTRSWPDGVGVRVRMGIHTGDATVVDGDYVGMSLHVTARVASAAHGGQVLLTDVTSQLAGRPSATDLGEHRLRDVPGSIRLHQVLAGGLPADFPAPRTLTALPNNLPAPTDEFVGRAGAIAVVAEALRNDRLVTLTGAAGTGKTRLALEVARRVLPEWPDGAWLVELAPVKDGGHVPAVVAGALRIGERPDQDVVDTVVDRLRHRKLVLLIDNCEHLVDAAAAFADRVLAGCPDVHVLTTSRELLGLRGEHAIRVAPLPVGGGDGGAEELLLARARQAVPGFERDRLDRALLADVCRRLDGLPLAIELAAVRLRTLTLAQLQARLDDRFRILTGVARTARSPQRTLEAVVTWSYELLSDVEQATFRRVAVFPDSFDLEGAEAVAAGSPVDPIDVLDLVSALVDKSLVGTVERDDAYRYQLLETLREYGRARSVDEGEEPAVRARLIGWAVGRADLVAGALRTPEQDAAIAAVTVDRANIIAAVDAALAAGAHQDALWITTMVPAMPNVERREVIGRLLQDTGPTDPAVRGHALCALANMAIELGDWPAVVAAGADAAHAFESTGERRHAAWARFLQAAGYWGAGDLTSVDRMLAEATETYEDLGDDFGLAWVLWLSGQQERDAVRADRRAAEAVRLFRRFGSPIGLAFALEGSAVVQLRRRDPETAAPLLAEAIGLLMGLGNTGQLAHAFEAAAACLAIRGALHDAAVILGCADSARRVTRSGHRPWEREAAEVLRHALAAGDADKIEAARSEGQALSIDVAAARATGALTDIQLRRPASA
jgi:predicted ATPase/class 3 adenylate cyclase